MKIYKVDWKSFRDEEYFVDKNDAIGHIMFVADALSATLSGDDHYVYDGNPPTDDNVVYSADLHHVDDDDNEVIIPVTVKTYDLHG